MKKLIVIAFLLVLIFCGASCSWSSSRNSMIQFFIKKELIAEFPVENRSFYRVSSDHVYLILERQEGLILLARTIEAQPQKGDLMDVKVFGKIMSSRRNTKSTESFSSILSSAFPPQIVSVHFDSKEELDKSIRDYSWNEKKSFLFDPLKRFPDLHPSSSLKSIELLHAQMDLSEYLFKKRKSDFFEFLGYENLDEIPEDEGYHEWIDFILSHHTESEYSGALRVSPVGTWIE